MGLLANLKNIAIVNIILVFSIPAFSNEMIKIHYTNGVNTLKKDARNTVNDISMEIYQLEKKVNLLYNPTGFNEKESTESHLAKDVLEVLFQKTKESTNHLDEKILKNHLERLISHNGFFNDYYKNRSKEIYKQLKNTENKYHFLINHSQGNLVSNQMCEYIKDKDHSLYKKLYAYGFGVPSNHISCGIKEKDKDNNSYVTFRFDNIINALRLLSKTMYNILDPLPANIISDNNSMFTISVHFMETYLTNEKSLNKFKKDFNNNIPKKFNLKDKVIAEYKYEDNLNLEYKNPKLTVLLKELQKCQDNKIGCNLEPYKDKISVGTNNTAMNACLMLSITRPNKDNDDSCNKLGKLNKSPEEIKKEFFYQLENSNTNPLIKYGNKTTKTLIKEIKKDLQNTFSAKELINFTNSLVNTVSFRDKVLSEKDVLNLILLNHQREFLAQNVLSTYYPKALTEYDFFVEEFFKDSYIAVDSLNRIKYYCDDKTNLECINHYNNARSIASGENNL